METSIQFRIEDFEGPLDLLLTLVQKNKMSIYEIEIMTLIDQYLQVVEGLQQSELDNASEFVAMAARLVQMKSVMLLPRSTEADRMREELTGLLVEYSACKQVASQLREMALGIYIVARRPLQLQLPSTYRGSHSPQELGLAFAGLTGRNSAKRMPRAEQFEPLVAAPIVSVTGRVIYILRGLKNGVFSVLKQPFEACKGRSEAVATFLALLELVRGGRVAIDKQEKIKIISSQRRQRPAAEDGQGGA